MRVLYISCEMGAAGDMLTAALLELFEDREAVLKELNDLEIPHVRFEAETTSKCGINGTHMHVYVDNEEEDEHMHEHHHDHEHSHEHHHHSHSSLHGISHIVNDHIHVSEKVRKDVMSVYQLIAEAESQVHGVDIENIHFHEVGTMDAVADITAVCYLLEKLSVDKIIVSPIHVGKGTVKCAHGILPVPAPATALILQGIPIYSKENINGELCTPTGAALLKHFASEFTNMPAFTVEKIGYGMGKKDFPQANCVRVFLGETAGQGDEVIELSCNVDDMTGEEAGYALNSLMENGALDAFTTAIGMKKGRPGLLFTVLCKEEDREQILKVLFRDTTTLGVRESRKSRYILERWFSKDLCEYGEVQIKHAGGYGVQKAKYEYEDLSRIAKEQGISLREVLASLNKK